MITELIKKADIQSWSAISLQTAILSLDGIQYFKGVKNSFIILSGVLILCLLCLQVVSRRFLMLYPVQQYMKRPSQKIDTTLLRCFLIISISFMLLGSVEKDLNTFKNVEAFLSSNLFWIIPIFIPLLPLLWHFIFSDLIRKSIVRDMKEHTVEEYGKCPNQDCNNIYAHFYRTVISENVGQVSTECEKCNKKYSFNETINIGY